MRASNRDALFFKFSDLKIRLHILFLLVCLFIIACSGSKKYFKAAERLEEQGLVNEAAEYYLLALQKKPTNVDARIKLKEVGQKYVSTLSSEFFRNYNTQQLESSLETFERLKDFTGRTTALNVVLDYPRGYEEDYLTAVESYCSKNYNQGHTLVIQKKYQEALPYFKKIEKYKSDYKNTKELVTIAICEPLYQSAVNSLETKNYGAALNLLSKIKAKSEDYKDSKDLLELASAQQTKSFILFEPKPAGTAADKQMQQHLYNSFSEAAQKSLPSIQIINNSPFQNAPSNNDLYNSTNIDLIQAIRKATGADYFYVFEIANKRESNVNPTRTAARGFQEVVTRVNDTTTKTEYRPFDYNVIKASRSFTYDYKYKIINAYSNQVISSQTQAVKATDAVEYNQFNKQFTGNINSLFPYNPQQVGLTGRYNASAWRKSFSARSELKSFDDLRNEAYNQNIRLFTNSAASMK